MANVKTDEDRAEAFVNSDIALLESGNFADATITCGVKTWNVHTIILGSRCEYFRAAFLGGFQESQSGILDLPEHDPEMVDAVVRYIYSKDIDITGLHQGKNLPSTCVKLWTTADYFRLDTLTSKVVDVLGDYLDQNLLLVCDNTQKFRKHHAERFKEILRAIQESYEVAASTPVKGMFVAFLWATRNQLLGESEITTLVDEKPLLAKDLLMSLIGTSVSQVSPWTPKDADRLSRDKRPVPMNSDSGRRSAKCEECRKRIDDETRVGLYDPFNVEFCSDEVWCKKCGDVKRANNSIPWR